MCWIGEKSVSKRWPEKSAHRQAYHDETAGLDFQFKIYLAFHIPRNPTDLFTPTASTVQPPSHITISPSLSLYTFKPPPSSSPMSKSVHPADVDVPSLTLLETGYQKVSKHLPLDQYLQLWRAVGHTVADMMLRGRGSRLEKVRLNLLVRTSHLPWRPPRDKAHKIPSS